jgi:hypothetical protein
MYEKWVVDASLTRSSAAFRLSAPANSAPNVSASVRAGGAVAKPPPLRVGNPNQYENLNFFKLANVNSLHRTEEVRQHPKTNIPPTSHSRRVKRAFDQIQQSEISDKESGMQERHARAACKSGMQERHATRRACFTQKKQASLQTEFPSNRQTVRKPQKNRAKLRPWLNT